MKIYAGRSRNMWSDTEITRIWLNIAVLQSSLIRLCGDSVECDLSISLRLTVRQSVSVHSLFRLFSRFRSEMVQPRLIRGYKSVLKVPQTARLNYAIRCE